MKFFSNETDKETTDDQDRAEADRVHTDVDPDAPAAIPQQRAGSPWSDAPGSADADAELAERERRDGTDDRPADDADREGFGDREPITDGEQDRVDDGDRDRLDDGDRDLVDDGDRDLVADPEVRDETADDAATTTYGPDGSVTTEKDADTPFDQDAVKDEGTFDSPTAVEPATGEPLDGDKTDSFDADRTDSVEADKTDSFDADHRAETEVADTDNDLGTSDTEAGTDKTFVASDEPGTTYAETDADKVDGAADAPVDAVPVAAVAVPTETTPAGDAAPVVAAVAVPAATATATPEQDRFFPAGDGYADRFRDIQLRFVDSPKEATAEASVLVGEALDKLTSALKERKESLDDDSEDTEKLRVALRGYRDLLNRLLSL